MADPACAEIVELLVADVHASRGRRGFDCAGVWRRPGAPLRADDIVLLTSHRPRRARLRSLLRRLPEAVWTARATPAGCVLMLQDGVPAASFHLPVPGAPAEGAWAPLEERLRAIAAAHPEGLRLQAEDLTAHERLALAPWGPVQEWMCADLPAFHPHARLTLRRHGALLAVLDGDPRDPGILFLFPA